MDVDQLLTTTRSARKALDLAAPVEIDVIRECLRIGMLAANGSEKARFVLERCIPVKLKAPTLNAKDGTVAIEELQIAYESLTRKAVSNA